MSGTTRKYEDASYASAPVNDCTIANGRAEAPSKPYNRSQLGAKGGGEGAGRLPWLQYDDGDDGDDSN